MFILILFWVWVVCGIISAVYVYWDLEIKGKEAGKEIIITIKNLIESSGIFCLGIFIVPLIIINETEDRWKAFIQKKKMQRFLNLTIIKFKRGGATKPKQGGDNNVQQ